MSLVVSKMESRSEKEEHSERVIKEG
jgi:hypothetical protein